MIPKERTPQDPERVAKIVRAAWIARQSRDEYRESLRETPLQALERRLERIEAALYDLARQGRETS